MKHLILFRWIAVLTLAIILTPSPASAQEADTLSISGTFGANGLWMVGENEGYIGNDLAEVLYNGNVNGWTLTLYGVSYSHDYYYDEWDDNLSYGSWEAYVTRVYATSFDFRFNGPDADILNEVVSQQLAGGLSGGEFLRLQNGDYFNSSYPSDQNGPYSSLFLGLEPVDPLISGGVFFEVSKIWDFWSPLFTTDEYGYPLVEPQRVQVYSSTITDQRPGNGGGLESYNDLVDIGSSEPPVLPPPPPPLPTLSIADASILEGNKGTTLLDLTVTLSNISSDVVTVNYTTANGTALAKSDYNAASGTLSIQPGQTQGTISIEIKGDRKWEPDETFFVQFSNAVGATINDGTATVTIVNDD